MSKPKYQDLDFQNTFRAINVPDPTAAQHVSTKNYTDNVARGLRYKTARAMATANVDISQLNNGDVVDGVTVATNDVVLLPAQTTASEDGLYTIGATAGTTVRTTGPSGLIAGDDARGLAVSVAEGTANGNKTYVQTAEPAIVGTDGLTFGVLGGGTTYTFDGNGIEESAGTVSIELDGTTLAKSASGLRVGSGAAGAGLTEASGVLAVGDGGEGVVVNANDVALDFGTVARWRTWLGPSGAGTTWSQAHGLGHKSLLVQLHRESDGLDVTDGVEITLDTTNITVTFGASQADRSAFRIVAVG